MPSTPKLSDIWECTLARILGHDCKSETGRVLKFWVRHHKLEEFYQLLSWDLEEFTSHGALSSHMENQFVKNPCHLHPSDRCTN